MHGGETTAYNPDYLRKQEKASIPVCNILGVDVAAIDMKWLVAYISGNLPELSGDYICVTNVHTVVTSYEDPE